MHTLAGEVKSCFAMLGGDAYTSSSDTAQAIRKFEETSNHRYMSAQVCFYLYAYLKIFNMSQSYATH